MTAFLFMGFPTMDSAVFSYDIYTEMLAIVLPIFLNGGLYGGLCVACISHIHDSSSRTRLISCVLEAVLEIIDTISFGR